MEVDEGEGGSSTDGRVWYAISALICLIMAGICSGLNIGLLRLDQLKLNTLELSGSAKEKKRVKKIKGLLEDRHLLLCVILIVDDIFMEIFP